MTEDRHDPPFPDEPELEAWAEAVHDELASARSAPPRLDPEALPPRRAAGSRGKRWLAAAAGLAVVGVGLAFWAPWRGDAAPAPRYRLLEAQGIERSPAPADARDAPLRAGERLTTTAGGHARLAVADLGELRLEPNSALRIGHPGEIDGEHFLQLERGAAEASIFAAPRLFQLGTPGGIAVDLGCIYRAEVEPDGRTRLQVRAGAVSFEAAGRQVYVPQGASVWASPGRGPGVPIRDAAAPAVREVLERLDTAGPPQVGDADFEILLTQTETEDALSLWHLMVQAAPARRGIYAKLLAQLVPMPAGYTAAECLDEGSPGFLAWRAAQPWRRSVL